MPTSTAPHTHTPQGSSPPASGGNGNVDGGGNSPPEPPDGPPPPEPEEDNDTTPQPHTPQTSDTEEAQTRSEEQMRPGTTRLISLLAFLALLCVIGYLLFTRGCASAPAVVLPVAPSASSTTPPPPVDSTMLTAEDVQKSGLCNGPAAEMYYMVGRANNSTIPLVVPLCNGEFVALPSSKARIMANNLIVSRSEKIESIWGNSMAYVGNDDFAGSQKAKNFFPLSHWLPGKTRVLVRLTEDGDTRTIRLEDPLLTITTPNGGDTFAQICAPYRAMTSAPSNAWELEVWSRCRRPETAANKAMVTTVVKHIAANPGVSRDDFATATAKIAALEEKVTKPPKVVIPPQVVDTNGSPP